MTDRTKITMGPDLFARINAIYRSLPPEDMSMAAVCQMCMTYYANHGDGVDIPRYSEKATRKARKWIRLQDDPPDLPNGWRPVDVIAWRVGMIDPGPVHPRQAVSEVTP
jgi:hypothetical protein